MTHLSMYHACTQDCKSDTVRPGGTQLKSANGTSLAATVSLKEF